VIGGDGAPQDYAIVLPGQTPPVDFDADASAAAPTTMATVASNAVPASA
jgi:hypothetical protein